MRQQKTFTEAIPNIDEVVFICTSKRIELESPGWSGLVANSKPDEI